MDISTVHAKWQAKWKEEAVFEPKAGNGAKFYLTAAFPYPNSPQHIGHARTYTTTDIYARFMRMQGKNVLFPMAFHVTGTPILGMAKRIEAKDKEIIEIFDKIYGIIPQKTATLTDPRELVLYFSADIEAGMKEIGFSIDWRRKFYTFDAKFNKFIQWQFRTLHRLGLITQGEHPVPWCSKDGQAVGAHDTRGDVDPKIEEVTTILFPAGEGFIPAFTYRPETIFGVTNMWANPNAKYVLANFKGKNLYLSAVAYSMLCEQIKLAKVRDISASEIFALKPKNPLTGEQVDVLEASFVKEDVGTGLVMSVPAHAPFDFLALRDLGLLEKVSLKAVLKTPGFEKFPAKEICIQMNVRNQSDELAEEATKILYKKEAHEGRMIIAGYEGMSGIQAKVKISKQLSDSGNAFVLYTLANGPVYSRSGNLCTVKVVDNQWFINYGEPEWKAKAHECLSQMSIFPEDVRKDFTYTIDWLEGKACTRAFGLGTRFPFDEKLMIEALSDSTIYMAYYTIAHIAHKMPGEKINDEFFDYVFLAREPYEKSKITQEWLDARKEFTYWYPLDSRHSALDLIRNHFTFFIFNHAAIFEKKFWPRQIVSNGLVTMEGAKMSKSMGNILPLRKAIPLYGPDVIRFIVTSSAELDADSDFNKSSAEGVISRINYLNSILYECKNEKKAPKDAAGKWFYSRLHSRIAKAGEQYSSLNLRSLSLSIFYDTINDLQWYKKRSSNVQLREFFELWTLLIAPFMPHIAEEFWEMLGKKQHVEDAQFVSLAKFPQADRSQIDLSLDAREDYLRSVLEDVASIQKILKSQKPPSSITFIVHAPYKEKVRRLVAEHKQMPIIMQKAKEDESLAPIMPKVSAVAAKFLKNISKSLGSPLGAESEYDALMQGAGFISSEFAGAKVNVLREEDAPVEFSKKAEFAQPDKPSIIIS